MKKCLFISFSAIAILLQSSPVSAKACNAEGYEEIVIEPAKLEYATIDREIYNSWGRSEERVFPAVVEVMTLKEYEALPSTMMSIEPVYIKAEFEKVPVNLPDRDLVEYDLIHYPNGVVFERPLNESPFNEIFETYLIKPDQVLEKEISVKRPEPQILPDGLVKVVIKPHYVMQLPIIGRQIKVTSRYLRSRSPAIIQLKPCNG